MEWSPTRRQALRSTALTGLAVTAGCVSTGNPGESSGDTESTELTPPGSLQDWLADANGYDGDAHRYGPGSQPDIHVGESVDGEMAFAPPVIEVPPMTIVHWEWTGHGGQHNVVALDGTFDSGRTNAQHGTCYRYLFEETGEYPYVSEPRADEGMKGAVIVKEPPSTGNSEVDSWIIDSDNFDGTVVDKTDVTTTTIAVGAQGNDGSFVFAPPVLRVSTDTTVRWKWTGNGGSHNVVFQDIDLASGSPVSEPGVHFEHSFEETGTYRYACAPHRALGMKGVVIVD